MKHKKIITYRIDKRLFEESDHCMIYSEMRISSGTLLM